MSTPLLRSFDRFEDATGARDALVAAGVPPAAVHIRAMEDEAGAPQGNFLVGNGRISSGGTLPDAPSQVPYELNFAHPVFRAMNLLVVEPVDEKQRAQAATILDQLGGINANRAREPGTGA